MSDTAASAEPMPAGDLGAFVRLPGVFRRSEVEEVLIAGAGFHVEHAGAAPPGTELFYVYRRLPTGADERPVPRPRGSDHAGRLRADAPSLGELKALHHEEHLCLKCNHHFVCGMAQSIDPNLLVTVTSCLGFEPDGRDDTDGVCELTPIEPLTFP